MPRTKPTKRRFKGDYRTEEAPAKRFKFAQSADAFQSSIDNTASYFYPPTCHDPHCDRVFCGLHHSESSRRVTGIRNLNVAATCKTFPSSVVVTEAASSSSAGPSRKSQSTMVSSSPNIFPPIHDIIHDIPDSDDDIVELDSTYARQLFAQAPRKTGNRRALRHIKPPEPVIYIDDREEGEEANIQISSTVTSSFNASIPITSPGASTAWKEASFSTAISSCCDLTAPNKQESGDDTSASIANGHLDYTELQIPDHDHNFDPKCCVILYPVHVSYYGRKAVGRWAQRFGTTRHICIFRTKAIVCFSNSSDAVTAFESPRLPGALALIRAYRLRPVGADGNTTISTSMRDGTPPGVSKAGQKLWRRAKAKLEEEERCAASFSSQFASQLLSTFRNSSQLSTLQSITKPAKMLKPSFPPPKPLEGMTFTPRLDPANKVHTYAKDSTDSATLGSKLLYPVLPRSHPAEAQTRGSPTVVPKASSDASSSHYMRAGVSHPISATYGGTSAEFTEPRKPHNVNNLAPGRPSEPMKQDPSPSNDNTPICDVQSDSGPSEASSSATLIDGDSTTKVDENLNPAPISFGSIVSQRGSHLSSPVLLRPESHDKSILQDDLAGANAFIQDAIAEVQKPSTNITADVQEQGRRQLHHQMTLAQGVLARLSTASAHNIRGSLVGVQQNGTNALSLGSNSEPEPQSTSSPLQAAAKALVTHIPPLPASSSREVLLGAQIARVKDFMELLKGAQTKEEKAQIMKLVRLCDQEYEQRISAIISRNARERGKAPPRLAPNLFHWPCFAESYIMLSDEED